MASATHVGREVELEVDGRTWRLSRMERRHTRTFEEWAQTVLPDPRKLARQEVRALALEALATQNDPGLSDQEKAALLEANRNAQEVATRHGLDQGADYGSIAGRPMQSLLRSEDGACRMCLILLREHQPAATEADAYAVLEAVGRQGLQQAFAQAEGQVPKNGAAPAATGAGGARPPARTGIGSTASSVSPAA